MPFYFHFQKSNWLKNMLGYYYLAFFWHQFCHWLNSDTYLYRYIFFFLLSFIFLLIKTPFSKIQNIEAWQYTLCLETRKPKTFTNFLSPAHPPSSCLCRSSLGTFDKNHSPFFYFLLRYNKKGVVNCLDVVE